MAGAVALGGLLALLRARRPALGSFLPIPGLDRLTEPTLVVIATALLVAAHQLAAPVFGWPGLRGPMGAIAALALVAAVGSVTLDLRRSDSEGSDEP